MEKNLIAEIENLIGKCWDDLKEAADKKDAAALAPLNGKMAELSRMKKDLVAINSRLQEMAAGAKNGSAAVSPGLRRIRIRVTQGMINQNLLTLTEALRRGIVRRGERFHIKVPVTGAAFDTVLMRVGNKLQERSAISWFYREAGVREGDIIELTETAPGCWELKPAQKVDPGDYLNGGQPTAADAQ